MTAAAVARLLAAVHGGDSGGGCQAGAVEERLAFIFFKDSLVA